MGQTSLYDLDNNLSQLVSIPPDETYTPSSDVNGTRVDCSAIEGPVQAICAMGAATGSPSAQSVVFELEEADDVGGANNQIVAIQRKATLTADDTSAILQGITTKPFCRVIVQDTLSTLTGGTTPTQLVSSTILGQKKSF